MLIGRLLKGKVLFVIPLILVLAIAAACGEDATPTPRPTATPTATPVPEGPTQGGTLKFVPLSDIETLDGVWTTAWATATHNYFVQDTLFALDENKTVQPQMVDTWTLSPDELTYTFKLRDGLKFHDGNPVTSEEAVASISRWAEKDALAKVVFGFKESFEAVDAKTFKLTLTEPVGVVLDMFVQNVTLLPVVYTKADASLPVDEQADARIGSGPFELIEWRPGASLIYRPFADYVPRDEPASFNAGGKVVYLDEVEWVIILDSTTKVASLETGQVDHVHGIELEFFDRLDSATDVTIFTDAQANTNYAFLNTLHPPFDDVAVRKAVQLAVDQERFLRATYPEPFWRECFSIFGCGGQVLESTVGSEDLAATDLEKAKQLIADSSYDGRDVVLMAATDQPAMYPPSLVTQDLLESIGMNVELLSMDWAAIVQRRQVKKAPDEGGWNVFHTWGPIRDNPLTAYILNPAILGWYENDRIAELKQQYLVTADPATRKKQAEEIQQIFYDEAGALILGENLTASAHSSDVKGFIQTPTHTFWNVWLDR